MDVRIECICPPSGGRHGHDTVTLSDHLDFTSAVKVRNAISATYHDDPDAAYTDVLAVLTEVYLLCGIESWSLIGEDGKPLEAHRPNIRRYLLSNLLVAMEVGNAADDLYAEAVVLPLVRKALTSSPDTQTDESTSPPTGSTEQPPRRSSPSSTSTTPTVVTEETSSPLAGDSSS